MNINLPFAVMPVIIFLDERLTKTDLRVLGAILSFMEPKTKQCWPKRKTIAQRCGISETKISTATTRLEVLGWLIKEGDGGRSCPSIYRFTVPARFESLNPESETVTDSETLTNKSTETVSISGRGKKETINKPIERV